MIGFLKNHNEVSDAQGRVLLLQGPVGPFYKNLRKHFHKHGIETRQVCFNKSDKLFSLKNNLFEFSGSLSDWRGWILNELTVGKYDFIVLFGSSRPVHEIARNIALDLKISVFSLEEGYLRSGFVTLEEHGNNSDSPIAKRFNYLTNRVQTYRGVDRDAMSFYSYIFYGAIQYFYRSITEKPIDRGLYHRRVQPIPLEAYNWARNFIGNRLNKSSDDRAFDNIINNNYQYHLIILQTGDDLQLSEKNARHWSNESLIEESLYAFSRDCSLERYLIIKTHPLNKDNYKLVSLIQELTSQYCLQDRVIILRNAHIPTLIKKSLGVITINSSIGFSVLNQCIPLLVLGNAVYAHIQVATLAVNKESIYDFFVGKHKKDKDTINSFIERVKRNALVPGDFYAHSSMQASSYNVFYSMVGTQKEGTHAAQTKHAAFTTYDVY